MAVMVCKQALLVAAGDASIEAPWPSRTRRALGVLQDPPSGQARTPLSQCFSNREYPGGKLFISKATALLQRSASDEAVVRSIQNLRTELEKQVKAYKNIIPVADVYFTKLAFLGPFVVRLTEAVLGLTDTTYEDVRDDLIEMMQAASGSPATRRGARCAASAPAASLPSPRRGSAR